MRGPGRVAEFLDEDGAQALGIHRSTVSYRTYRIGELTRLDLRGNPTQHAHCHPSPRPSRDDSQLPSV
ncbi:helix-turn-helix domain-containing protein [Pseudonocardia aurantiaca]|uniref:Helix-turn-helix domain-containing protein n=1 Tax=Pseudonocardia aurantiaca TaxID=75290 RepID=A0ABW4FLT4_9PSEU